MSRIGDAPITIPSGVNIEITPSRVTVTGPLGELNMEYLPKVKVEVVDNQVIVKRKHEDKFSKSLHGLTRSLINNMIIGVEKGWEKKLELVGVGYKAAAVGEKLSLAVGYSHPVEIAMPEGIKFAVTDNTKITISGIDKIKVGQIAAKIRDVRPPEPYKGKGIRYTGEYIRRKAGKAGKVGAGAAK
ncbi:MAG: 50S ribosomal protein L6 [Microgenomates group bacterium]|jgi:large subunit ribosomal protein L6